jgi:transcriptional regulator NrdR family protein
VAKFCPECGAPSHTADSRMTSRNRTRRRRVCDNGHAYTTYEITADAYAELAKRTIDARKRVIRYLRTIERQLNPGG